MKKLLLIITMITIASCGGNSNNNAKPVSKIDAFIETMSKDSQVFSAKIFKNPEDGKSGKYLVLDVLLESDDDSDYESKKLVFDMSVYEQGESWAQYLKKYTNSYVHESDNLNGTDYNEDNFRFTIPKANEVTDLNINYVTSNSQGDFNVEVGDYYFVIASTNFLYILEETESTSKDLEKIGALQEDYEKSLLMEKLSVEFGLSEERSIEVSNMIHSWKKISKKRSMTKSDANLFSQEILGADMETAEIAYKQMAQGSSSNYESLINTAAEANDISPEHMEELVSDLMN